MVCPYEKIVTADPGVNGGLAFWTPEGVRVQNMPDTPDGVAFALDVNNPQFDTLIVIEEVPLFLSRACPSVSAMAKLQRSYGVLMGVAVSTGASVETVTPQSWQKAVGAGHKATYGDGWKAHLRDLAKEAFPGVKVTLKNADALLILKKTLTEWGIVW